MITWLKERYKKNPVLFIGTSLVMAIPLYLILAVIGSVLYVVAAIIGAAFGVVIPGWHTFVTL